MASMIKLMAAQMEAMENTFLTIFFDAATKMADMTSSKVFFLMETVDGTRKIGGHPDMLGAFTLATLLPQPSDIVIDGRQEYDQALAPEAQECSKGPRKRWANQKLSEAPSCAKRSKTQSRQKSTKASAEVKQEFIEDTFEMDAIAENGREDAVDGEDTYVEDVDGAFEDVDGAVEDVDGAVEDVDGAVEDAVDAAEDDDGGAVAAENYEVAADDDLDPDWLPPKDAPDGGNSKEISQEEDQDKSQRTKGYRYDSVCLSTGKLVRECVCCLGSDWEPIEPSVAGAQVWKYFARKKGVKSLFENQCLRCSSVLRASSTSNLRTHLHMKHGINPVDRHTVMANFKSTTGLDTMCKCLMCHRLFSRPSSSTLRGHLKRLHGIVVKEMRHVLV